MNRRETQKIDQKTGRAINRQMILNIIRRSDGLSRADIAAQTGLSAAVVGFVIRELLDEGYLVEEKPRDSRSGRRPVPLRLNENGHLAIGLKISSRRLDCLLTDIAMGSLDRLSIDLPDGNPDTVVAHARQIVDEVVNRQKGPKRPILGVGLSLPARVDPDKGICIRSHRLGWNDVPIGPMMREALNLPVFIEDDTLAYGLAHALFGIGQNLGSFCALAVGEGIGCASIIDGQVWRGSLGNAGKVGHVFHQDGGPFCECGRRGCLQTFYAATALEERWSKEGRKSSLCEALQNADQEAQALVAEAGAVIGQYLANWVTVVDPELIVLGGESTAFGEAFLVPMQAALDHFYYREQGPRIVPDDTSFYWTAGAAAVAIQHVFKDPYPTS